MTLEELPSPPCSFERYLEAADPGSYLKLPETEWEAQVARDQQDAAAFFDWAVANLPPSVSESGT